MAGMVNGKWVATMPAAEEIKGGKFVRIDSTFRDRIGPDGAFPAEPGRYHLWVSYNCPWASRALVWRVLKGLEEIIPVHAAAVGLGGEGWTFAADGEGNPHPEGFALHNIYSRAVSDYTGKVTVPTLWDSRTGRIVNNESAEIVRNLDTCFDHLTGNTNVLCPDDLREEIDRWNALIYPSVNNGVYRAGFATAQSAYEEAARELFAMLDRIDDHLGTSRYLVGEWLTEADWRLFTTLVRFDIAYHGAFKCNLKRIADYPNLSGYLRELYQWPGIAGTVRLDEIKAGYYLLANVNSHRIVPIGPPVDLTSPHGREGLPGKGIRQRT